MHFSQDPLISKSADFVITEKKTQNLIKHVELFSSLIFIRVKTEKDNDHSSRNTNKIVLLCSRF